MWAAIYSEDWRKYTATPLFHPAKDKQPRGGRYNVGCIVYYIRPIYCGTHPVLITRRGP